MERLSSDSRSHGRFAGMHASAFGSVLAVACVVLMTVFLSSCSTTSYNEDSWFGVEDGEVWVQLDANATTGYGWVVSVDGGCVEVLGDEYVPFPAPSSMVGVGGIWRCRIGACADGTSLVRFDYTRPWDLSDIADSRLLSVRSSNGKVVSVEELSL